MFKNPSGLISFGLSMTYNDNQITRMITQMPYNKIIDAAVDAFKQNLTSFCQMNDHCLNTLDDKSFDQLSHGLMKSAQIAGKTGLCEFLKNHDMISS